MLYSDALLPNHNNSNSYWLLDAQLEMFLIRSLFK